MVSFLSIVKVAESFRKVRSGSIQFLVGQYCFCFVDLSYRMALATPLYVAVSEFIVEIFLFKKALYFFAEERLCLCFCDRELFVAVPPGYVPGEMTVKSFAEIKCSSPVKLIQLCHCIYLSRS